MVERWSFLDCCCFLPSLLEFGLPKSPANFARVRPVKQCTVMSESGLSVAYVPDRTWAKFAGLLGCLNTSKERRKKQQQHQEMTKTHDH